MWNKLWYLVGVSLKRKIKTKWFVIANVLLVLFLVGLSNIDTIVKSFGGDFDDKINIYVKAEENFTESIDAILTENSKMIYDEKEKFLVIEYDEEKYEEEKDILLEVDTTEEMKVKFISYDKVDSVNYQIITQALNQFKTAYSLENSNIDQEELASVMQPLEIERIMLIEDSEGQDDLENAVLTAVFPFLVLPTFMLTIFLVQMIGAEVNDEKTTRGMEIIISNVDPKTHFFSKVLAGNIFVLIQGGILLLGGALALITRLLVTQFSGGDGAASSIKDVVSGLYDPAVVDKVVAVLPFALVLMLLTFLAYSLLAGIFASMTTNIEDFQQLQSPIMIVLLIGYYLAILSGVFPGAVFIKVASFIPLISSVLSPALLLTGQITFVEAIITLVLLGGFNFLLIKYGLRIYKVGILNYSSKGLWKKMFKALKTKNI